MHAALLISAKDLRQRLRDRSAWVVGLIVPLALAAVLDVTFGGAMEGQFVPTYGVAVEDDGELGAAFRGVMVSLGRDGTFEVVAAEDGTAARRAVTEGAVDAALVVPAGFSAAATGPAPLLPIVVIGTDEAPLSAQVARAIADGFLAAIEARRLAVGTAIALGAVDIDPTAVIAAVEATPPAVRLATGEVAASQLDMTTYLAAAMAVFFVFFTVQFGVISLLEERRLGTLARLHASPLSRWSPVAAKALSSVALGIISLTTLAIATTHLLGASWGASGGVALLVVAAVLSAVGVLAVIAAVARTPEQAGVWQSVVAVLLGALGGVFFDVTQGNVILERLSLLTPHQWFLRGLGSVRAEGTAGAWPAVAALLAFGLAGVVLAGLLGRREARA